MFSRKGVVIIDSEDLDEDEVMMVALDAGADDMIVNEDNFEIRTDPAAFNDVHQAVKEAGYEIFEAEIEQIPSMEANVTDESAIKSLTKLITSLEDNDDVQKDHHHDPIAAHVIAREHDGLVPVAWDKVLELNLLSEGFHQLVGHVVLFALTGGRRLILPGVDITHGVPAVISKLLRRDQRHT